MSSDARVRFLIREAQKDSDEKIASLESDLSQVRRELDQIKAHLVQKSAPKTSAPPKPVRSDNK